MSNVRLFLIIFQWTFALFSPLFGQTSVDAAATGISRAFSPAISVNGLFYGLGTDRSQILWSELGLESGMHYQEICLEMTANVDVYLQSKIAFSADEQEGLGVEEAYLTTLRMPLPIIIRGGKMLNTFGRHNLYHLHHMAFAELPIVLNQVFGPDLNEVGIETSYLLPLPWYSDVVGGFLNGNNERLFNSSKKSDFAYLAHWDNVYDVTEELCLRLGGSYLTGNRGLYYADQYQTAIGPDTSRISSRTWGLDLYVKWKPLKRGRYRSFVLQGEYVRSNLRIEDQLTRPVSGFFLQALNQLNLRWWIQARYDWYNRPKELYRFFPGSDISFEQIGADLDCNRWSVALAYVPTEFSAYRLQYNRIDICGEIENQFLVQVNVTIGSHPAHKY
jgi:hypothetical protein